MVYFFIEYGNIVWKYTDTEVEKSVRTRTRLIAICLVCLLPLCGCAQLQPARPIMDVHNMDGQRIAVGLAWSPDYMLSGRKDIVLQRYNATTDMIMALKYRRVDAIAMDVAYAKYMCAQMPALEMIPEPIAVDQVLAFFATDEPELLAAFNAFLEDFIGTPEYEDILRRFDEFETSYEYVEIPEPQDGGVITLTVEQDLIPYSYWDFSLKKIIGSDVDIMRYFAVSMGCRLEIIFGSYTSCIANLLTKKADVMAGGLSEWYRHEVELSGNALVSNNYMDVDILLVVMGDASLLGEVPDTLVEYEAGDE